jgi:hypothetical protein
MGALTATEFLPFVISEARVHLSAVIRSNQAYVVCVVPIRTCLNALFLGDVAAVDDSVLAEHGTSIFAFVITTLVDLRVIVSNVGNDLGTELLIESPTFLAAGYVSDAALITPGGKPVG